MSWTKVRNVNGSGRFPAPSGYSTWLEYWEDKAGMTASVCGAYGCNRKDLVGAHVQKVGGYDNSWYITPICKSCNQRTDEFEVYFPLVPVPSNL